MTTSIKEALELKPCPFCGKQPVLLAVTERDNFVRRYEIRCDNCRISLSGEYEDDAAETWNTRATFHPDGEGREAIARLATRFWSIHPKEIQDMGLTREQFYVREMTNLLASGLVQDEAEIRRDEREKCAKICDALGDEIMERAEEADENEEYDEYESLECAATEYSRAAAAIRSARDGGAS